MLNVGDLMDRNGVVSEFLLVNWHVIMVAIAAVMGRSIIIVLISNGNSDERGESERFHSLSLVIIIIISLDCEISLTFSIFPN